MRQYGECLHSCPSGYYGHRAPDMNRCASKQLTFVHPILRLCNLRGVKSWKFWLSMFSMYYRNSLSLNLKKNEWGGIRTLLLYLLYRNVLSMGLLWWLRGRESTWQSRRHELDPWVGKIPWRRKWQPTPVFLPGKFHGQRSLAGYTVHGVAKELDTTQQLNNSEYCTYTFKST